MKEPAAKPTPSASPRVHDVLARIFQGVRPGIQYRLWDGSEGTVGAPDGAFTVVIHDRTTLIRMFSSSDTQAIADAYVDGRVDVEGDLFACIRAANQVEERTLPLSEKLRILFALRRIGWERER